MGGELLVSVMHPNQGILVQACRLGGPCGVHQTVPLQWWFPVCNNHNNNNNNFNYYKYYNYDYKKFNKFL